MTISFHRTAAGVALILVLLSSCEPKPEGRELRIAVAANLFPVFEELSSDYSRRTGAKLVRVGGSTAQLTQQIESGIPVDVFLSADQAHVSKLIAGGFADPSSRAIFARGQLVLWAPGHPEVASLEDLARASVRRVGCANPSLAPYGAASVETLKNVKLWDVAGPKLVFAQSISAAKQFADSGNAEAAFTALSLVYNLPGHFLLIDERLHAPLDQELCILSRAPDRIAARRFHDYLLSEEAQKILARYGYSTPAAKR